MRKIYKYEVRPDDPLILDLPRDAEVLSIQVQRGKPFMWVLVDPDAKTERRTFFILATGQVVPDGAHRFVDTFQIEEFVFHLFEVVS